MARYFELGTAAPGLCASLLPAPEPAASMAVSYARAGCFQITSPTTNYPTDGSTVQDVSGQDIFDSTCAGAPTSIFGSPVALIWAVDTAAAQPLCDSFLGAAGTVYATPTMNLFMCIP